MPFVVQTAVYGVYRSRIDNRNNPSTRSTDENMVLLGIPFMIVSFRRLIQYRCIIQHVGYMHYPPVSCVVLHAEDQRAMWGSPSLT